jgi:hypothetical protein
LIEAGCDARLLARERLNLEQCVTYLVNLGKAYGDALQMSVALRVQCKSGVDGVLLEAVFTNADSPVFGCVQNIHAAGMSAADGAWPVMVQLN